MDFIKSHFEISFDEKNIHYKSLLYNSDFDYLKDTPIKKFEINPPVYNFLFEVQELINNNEAYVDCGELVIPVENFVKKLEDENNYEFCYNMTLKKPISFNMEIQNWGLIPNSFRFEYEIQDKKYKDCKIIGCFAVKGKDFYVIDSHLYALFKAMKSVENLPDENKDFNVWNAINNVKNESVFSHSVLKGFFNKERIIIPSTMSLDIQNADSNIRIVPLFSGLNEDEQKALQEKLNLRYIDNSYSFSVNNETVRVVLAPKIKENLAKIFDLPREIRNKERQRLLLSNPVGFLPNKDIVSIENLSDRIIDFGMYKAVKNSFQVYENDWVYPIKLQLYDISGQLIDFKINDKFETKEFKELLEEAVENNYSFFDYKKISIPLSTQNIKVLGQFLGDVKDKTNIDNNEEKIVDEVNLLTEEEKYIRINITESLFEDLKNQVAKIRELNITDGTIFKISLNNHQIPLNEYNKKQLKKVFEMHIIVSEDEDLTEQDNEQLYDFFSSAPIEIPKSLKRGVKLKNYQKKGLEWLQNSFKLKDRKANPRKGVLLADDMGLGKTLQILSFLFWLKDNEKYNKEYFNEQNKKPILIVAPVILLDNWKNEYFKFFYDSLGTPLILHGDTLKNLKIREGNESYQFQTSSDKAELHLDINKIAKSNIVITNYNTLVNYEFSFASIKWSVVVLDEAQEIKERSSHKSTVAKGLNTDFKIACTGTPVENSLMDLWNIFNFLQPNLLGTSRDFQLLCRSLSEQNDEDSEKEIYDEIRNKLFYEKPYAYILRREKENVLGELPQKTIEPPYKVPLSEKQIEIYKELKENMLFSSTSEAKLKAFSDMHKFSQHPRMISNKDTESAEELINECPKFKKLIEILENIKLKKEKVLIFCNYREIQRYLKIVLEHQFNIENIDIINGEAKNRQAMINKFQENDDTFKILILSPRAAGVGLNIVKANHVIHYGRWWNPAKENQATDRVYRIGQEKEVHVYYLIDVYPDKSEYTFDEKLHSLIMKKIELAKNFLLPNNNEIATEFSDSFISYLKENIM